MPEIPCWKQVVDQTPLRMLEKGISDKGKCAGKTAFSSPQAIFPEKWDREFLDSALILHVGNLMRKMERRGVS